LSINQSPFTLHLSLYTNLPTMRHHFHLFVFLLLALSCSQDQKKNIVVINTSYGDITILLYDKTPLHTRNFMKLAAEHYFDSTLFHRVIQNFVIQGGDPDSKSALPGQALGEGGPAYTIPFEYVPEYFHKRGAVGMGRENDDVNPGLASSGSQFYICQGKIFDDNGLEAVIKKVEKRNKKYILLKLLTMTGNKKLLADYRHYDEVKDTLAKQKIEDEYKDAVEAEFKKLKPWVLTDRQKEIYKTLGGIPHLDGYYTVFGEVIKGMEVVDKIAAVRTDSLDRPLDDIPMKVSVVK
jgi:cyclophilin family peptidyl-prolyl cis-trans isomerase